MNRTTRPIRRTLLGAALVAGACSTALATLPAVAAEATLGTDPAGDVRPQRVGTIVPRPDGTPPLGPGALDLVSLSARDDDDRITFVIDVVDLADAPLAAFESTYFLWLQTPGSGAVHVAVQDNLAGDPDSAAIGVTGPRGCCTSVEAALAAFRGSVEDLAADAAADPVATVERIRHAENRNACAVDLAIDVASDEIRVSCDTAELSAALVAAGASPVSGASDFTHNVLSAGATYGTPGATLPTGRIESGLHQFHHETYDDMHPEPQAAILVVEV